MTPEQATFLAQTYAALMESELPATLKVLRPVPEGADAVAVVGENRKMLVFQLGELPEMGRGAGVQLQRYRDGGLADVTVLKMSDGLSWSMGGDSGRTRTEAGRRSSRRSSRARWRAGTRARRRCSMRGGSARRRA